MTDRTAPADPREALAYDDAEITRFLSWPEAEWDALRSSGNTAVALARRLLVTLAARYDEGSRLDDALFALGGMTFRVDALRGAAKGVLAYGAEPPEYPGLVLVPKADLDLLRAAVDSQTRRATAK